MSRSPAPGWTPPPATEADGRAVVLYVDDDKSACTHAKSQLESAYLVVSAHNDRGACSLIKEHQRRLVAVIFDIDLHGSVLDGIHLTKMLRGKLPRIALPPFARDIPPLDIPVLLLVHPDSTSRTPKQADGSLRRPVALGPLTLALTNWHLRRFSDV